MYLQYNVFICARISQTIVYLRMLRIYRDKCFWNNLASYIFSVLYTAPIFNLCSVVIYKVKRMQHEASPQQPPLLMKKGKGSSVERPRQM